MTPPPKPRPSLNPYLVDLRVAGRWIDGLPLGELLERVPEAVPPLALGPDSKAGRIIRLITMAAAFRDAYTQAEEAGAFRLDLDGPAVPYSTGSAVGQLLATVACGVLGLLPNGKGGVSREGGKADRAS